ncbi:MAG: hypothetical protein RJB66_876 [Pseudomonadota bacterium]|jgi:(2Fe-2S) ferredoxin
MRTPQFKVHFFVCTNAKEKGSSCGPKEASTLRIDLKKRLEEKFPDKKNLFRINAAGCLGQCEKGIAAVCYPNGDWKTGLNIEDLPELEKWLSSMIQKIE